MKVYDFRVYASGPCHPVHPARFVPQYPMGAYGHGSAGLPEISEDRVPRSVLITCAGPGPTALLVRLHRTLRSFELTGNGQSTRHFESVVRSIKARRPQIAVAQQRPNLVSL